MKRNSAIILGLATAAMAVLATSAFATTKYENTLTAQGVKVYYNLDEPTGSSLALASGPGVDPNQNALLYNSLQSKYNVPGVLNGAVWLRGGAYAAALQGSTYPTPSVALAGSGGWSGWTCEFWYNPGSSFADNGIFGTLAGTNSFFFHFQGASVYLGLGDGALGGGGHQSINTYPLNIPLNSWSLLAETFDGSTEKFYVNGLLTATLHASDINNGIGSLSSNWQLIEIGSSAALDELAIFDHVLTQNDFLEQMNSVPEPGLLSLLAIGGVFMVWRRRKAAAKRA